MSRQLALIDLDERDWRLDERTKEIGLRGIAEARAALHRRRDAEPPPQGTDHPNAA